MENNKNEWLWKQPQKFNKNLQKLVKLLLEEDSVTSKLEALPPAALAVEKMMII
jgi:hypothetical protein